MVTGGIECIAGSVKDQTFGSAVLFGLGGINVELFSDHSLRICPLSEQDANNMIVEALPNKLISGYRNKGPFDKKVVIDVLLKISQLCQDFPSITEIDINPLVVLDKEQGAIVVDALIITDKFA